MYDKHGHGDVNLSYAPHPWFMLINGFVVAFFSRIKGLLQWKFMFSKSEFHFFSPKLTEEEPFNFF